MKTKLLLLLSLLMLPAVAAQVSYDIETEAETANISVDILLDCNRFNCPELTWGKPSDYRLVNITDANGKIENYDENSEQVVADTGSPIEGQEKVVTLNFRTDKEADEIYDGLYRRRLSLSGFSDESMQGTVYSQNLSSGDVGYGFQSSYSDKRFNFTGQGPVNIDVNFGSGMETDYFIFYGEEPGFDTEEVYEISVGTTGLVQSYERIPVAIMPSERYNQTQTKWSAGEYSSGSIRLRDAEDTSLKATLGRETVHALNDNLLDWDATSSSYMDEGTSEFVGYLFERRQVPVDERDGSVRQIFGESVRVDKDPNDGYYTRIPSRGDKETLWNYYQGGADFMKAWKPGDSQYRSFGYAYSQLIVRHNLIEKNITLKEMYDYLEVDREIESAENKWQVLSEDLDLTPCKSESREEFNRCLEEVNDHSNFESFRAEPNRNQDNLVINDTETPEYEDNNLNYGSENRTVTDGIEGRESFGSFIKSILNFTTDLINSLLLNIGK